MLGAQPLDQRLRRPAQDRPATRVQEGAGRRESVLRPLAVGQDHLWHALAAFAADVGAREVADGGNVVDAVAGRVSARRK